MKFYKSDFIKMGGAAILTALLFFFIFYGRSKPPKSKSGTSEWISWDTAQTYQNDYLGSKNPHPLKTLYYDEKGNVFFETLQGFKLDAGQLNDIINNNLTTEIPDEVAFYFGMDGLIVNPNNSKDQHAKMHIIAIGMRGGELLLPKTKEERADKDKCSIADKADPCPPSCPTIPPTTSKK